jgi:hypothetical protein
VSSAADASAQLKEERGNSYQWQVQSLTKRDCVAVTDLPILL